MKQNADKNTGELALEVQYSGKINIEGKIAEVKAKLNRWSSEYSNVCNEITEIHAKGVIYAGIWWKDGKYLYLVYPSKAGEKRQREYVGRDENEIKATLERIARGERLTILEAKRRTLENRMDAAASHLFSATSYLRVDDH